jgi:hypothetical protein
MEDDPRVIEQLPCGMWAWKFVVRGRVWASGVCKSEAACNGEMDSIFSSMHDR